MVRISAGVLAVALFLCGLSFVYCTPPNIVFILTDDQDVVLGGMDPMNITQKLLKDQGQTFTNMFVTSPLCCPSRSTILTGRYIHNHKAINNSISGNCSSTDWQNGPEQKTIPTYLKPLNYNTFFAGKYLNQYGNDKVGGVKHIPAGWDSWYGLVGNSKYYNYSVSNDGVEEKHGNNYEKDYFTDLLTKRAVSFIDRADFERPVFMMISTPACHEPDNPAPQYANNFSTDKAPRTKHFNVAGGKTKHWLIRNAKHPMSTTSIDFLDDLFRKRWRTLLSVDDLVNQVVSALEKRSVLNNTYIIFTSDNGYHLGQFSLPIDKRQLYEFDIRVPFFIRGPGLKPNVEIKNPILSIDIAPTIIELAGGKPDKNMDGRSIVPLLIKTNSSSEDVTWRNDFLVQHVGEHMTSIPECPKLGPGVYNCHPDCVCEDSWNNTYSCVRTLTSTDDNMYCEFADHEAFVELYNLKDDPNQLTNIATKIDPKELKVHHDRLISLVQCAGDSCRSNSDMDMDETIFV